MVQTRNLSAAMLGIRGVRVLAVWELADERHLLIETTREGAFCRDCGARAESKGRDVIRVRDLPGAGKATVLLWHKRIWRCVEDACQTGSWRERHPAMAPRKVLTERARFEIARLVGQARWSVAAAAREFGVAWDTAMRCVEDVAARLFAEQHIYTLQQTPCLALGVDEKVMNRAVRLRRRRDVTVLVDITRGVPLDVVDGRTTTAVNAWLRAQTPSWRAGVQVATLDPAAAYRSALTDDDHGLPNATLVLDHFHAIRLANRMLDDVRRRVTRETLGRRGRKNDPIYVTRKLGRLARQRLDAAAYRRLQDAWAAQDPHFALECAWVAKELVRNIYLSTSTWQAASRLREFYRWAAEVEVPEVTRLARTVSRWRDELLAYFHTGRASNGPVEAVNRNIDGIQRTARGFRNFANFRLRILLSLTVSWNRQPTKRLRGPRAQDITAAPSSIA